MAILIGIGSCSDQIWKLKLENNTLGTNKNVINNIIISKKYDNTESNLLLTALVAKYSDKQILYDKENIRNGLKTNYHLVSSFQIPNLKKSETLNVLLDFKCDQKYFYLPKQWTYTLTTYSTSHSSTTSLRSSTSSPSQRSRSERKVNIKNIKGENNYTIDCKLKFNENNYLKFSDKITDIPDEPKNYVNHPLSLVINSAVDYIDDKLAIGSKKYSEFDTIFYNFDYKVHRSLINRSYHKVVNRISELESIKENRTHELYYTLGLSYHLIGNLKLAKKYYLTSIDLYSDQEINYPELALKFIN